MRHVRFIPSELGEETLRSLARGAVTRGELGSGDPWDVHGDLELDIGLTAPLRLTCGNPVKHALEPLCELANWLASGRSNLLSTVMGTAAFSRSSHLHHRWHSAFDAVVLLGQRDSTIGVAKHADGALVTVLETDDQPELEDKGALLTRSELLTLPAMLWDDLDGLLQLVGIELDSKEQLRWERQRLELE